MGPDEKAQREIASWTSVITRYCKKGREKRFNYYMTLMMVNIFSSKICETKKQFMCSADLSGPCPKRLLCANCGILKQLFYSYSNDNVTENPLPHRARRRIKDPVALHWSSDTFLTVL